MTDELIAAGIGSIFALTFIIQFVFTAYTALTPIFLAVVLAMFFNKKR